MQNLITRALDGLKTFYHTRGVQGIIAHKKKPKNLIEMLAFYPNKGEHFKAWKNDWPADKFIIIQHLNLTDTCHGEITAFQYENGLRISDKAVVVKDAHLRKVWSHAVRPGKVILDNGMEYDEVDFQRFKEAKFKNDKRVD